MAIVDVTKQSTGKPNDPKEYTYKAVADGDTVKIDAGFKDLHTAVHFLGGTAESTITVKAGNGYAGVNDMAFKLGINKYMTLVLDSARFMNVTGENRGKIVLTATKACSIAVIEMGVPAQSEPNA